MEGSTTDYGRSAGSISAQFAQENVSVTGGEVPGLAAIAAMADQVAAGVQDVYAAWYCFRTGTDGPVPEIGPNKQGDRITEVWQELHQSVQELRALAAEIRSRA